MVDIELCGRLHNQRQSPSSPRKEIPRPSAVTPHFPLPRPPEATTLRPVSGDLPRVDASCEEDRRTGCFLSVLFFTGHLSGAPPCPETTSSADGCLDGFQGRAITHSAAISIYRQAFGLHLCFYLSCVDAQGRDCQVTWYLRVPP